MTRTLVAVARCFGPWRELVGGVPFHRKPRAVIGFGGLLRVFGVRRGGRGLRRFSCLGCPRGAVVRALHLLRDLLRDLRERFADPVLTFGQLLLGWGGPLLRQRSLDRGHNLRNPVADNVPR